MAKVDKWLEDIEGIRWEWAETDKRRVGGARYGGAMWIDGIPGHIFFTCAYRGKPCRNAPLIILPFKDGTIQVRAKCARKYKKYRKDNAGRWEHPGPCMCKACLAREHLLHKKAELADKIVK